MIETIYTSPDELYHHGVKGQKWGVRRYGYSNGAQVRGYRIASKYTQKRNVKALKAKKRSGQLSKERYVKEKRQIKMKAMADRGKFLVEHGQNNANVTLKTLGTNAALDIGSVAATSVLLSVGGFPAVFPVVLANGVAKGVNTGSAINKLREIDAYDKSKRK